MAESKPMSEPVLSPQLEVCLCAAIQMPDGYIVRGHRHNDCIRTIGGIVRYMATKHGDCVQGFLTSRGRFTNRVDGANLQINAGIESKCEDYPYLNGELYSEDLY